MHFTDSGSGTALVLLHAYPVDSRMWDAVRPGLAAHHRVITPDQGGLGRTPLPAAAPSLDVVAADVVALLDRLDLPRVVLGGCSMGGYVAMAVLRAAPERVAGLVLVDTKAEADTEEAAANRLALADRAEAEGIGWLADAVLPSLVTGAGDDVRALIDDQSPAGVAWAQRAMAARPDSTELLRDSGIPTLVITGAEDSLIPPSIARSLAETTGGELAVIDGCGHLPSVQRPDEFVAVLSGWLSGGAAPTA